jgi:nucleoside-diphosphate-sugar epimerase
MPIPTPEPGLVISYSYLWHREHEAGREEGRKDRPSVIVLTVERPANDTTLVVVLPITHSAPADPTSAVEIPAAVKRHLGLDHERSWIVVAEGNEFDWPGYDIRRIGRNDRYDYGFLPPRFFKQVIEAFAAWHRSRKAKFTPRD